MQLTCSDIFDGVNAIRANPHTAMLKIKQQLGKFQSNTTYRNKEGVRIRTMSGKPAWQDAILSLQRQKHKQGLVWNNSLAMAAEQYKNIVSSTPDANVNPFDIIKSHCSYDGMISFNLNESEQENDISDLIAGMIVCDGNQEQGTRTAIFHPKYKQFGCAIQNNGKKMIVYMAFAEKVESKASGSYSGGQNNQQGQNTEDTPSKTTQNQQLSSSREDNYQTSIRQPYMNNQSGLGLSSEPQGFRSYQGEKIVVRRVKKSQVRVQNGRKYKVTATLVIFEDGAEQQTIEEDLIG